MKADDALHELHRRWREEPILAHLQLLLWVLRRHWEDRHMPILEEVYEALEAGHETEKQFFRTTVEALGERAARLKQRIPPEWVARPPMIRALSRAERPSALLPA